VATPARAGSEVEFARDIQPILESRCWSCHGTTKQKSGLRLDQRDGALMGGDSGPVILPGKSSQRELLRRITSADKSTRMPPTGEALSAGQIALLKLWIDGGAMWGNATATRDARQAHWALQPIVRPPLPHAREPQSSARNPIDLFIHAKLAEK